MSCIVPSRNIQLFTCDGACPILTYSLLRPLGCTVLLGEATYSTETGSRSYQNPDLYPNDQSARFFLSEYPSNFNFVWVFAHRVRANFRRGRREGSHIQYRNMIHVQPCPRRTHFVKPMADPDNSLR